MFFEIVAPLYDSFMKRAGLDLSVRLAAIIAPAPGLTVLDLGGGTGLNDAPLVEKGAAVTILDASPAMLKRARLKNLPVRLVRGRAERMPFADVSFDVVLISDAWHHFQVQDRVAREVRRVLKPGGRVVVAEFDPRHPAIRLVAALERMVLEPSAFQAPDRLAAAFARAGIEGETKALSPLQYVFVGTRQKESLLLP